MRKKQIIRTTSNFPGIDVLDVIGVRFEWAQAWLERVRWCLSDKFGWLILIVLGLNMLVGYSWWLEILIYPRLELCLVRMNWLNNLFNSKCRQTWSIVVGDGAFVTRGPWQFDAFAGCIRQRWSLRHLTHGFSCCELLWISLCSCPAGVRNGSWTKKQECCQEHQSG